MAKENTTVADLLARLGFEFSPDAQKAINSFNDAIKKGRDNLGSLASGMKEMVGRGREMAFGLKALGVAAVTALTGAFTGKTAQQYVRREQILKEFKGMFKELEGEASKAAKRLSNAINVPLLDAKNALSDVAKELRPLTGMPAIRGSEAILKTAKAISHTRDIPMDEAINALTQVITERDFKSLEQLGALAPGVSAKFAEAQTGHVLEGAKFQGPAGEQRKMQYMLSMFSRYLDPAMRYDPKDDKSLTVTLEQINKLLKEMRNNLVKALGPIFISAAQRFLTVLQFIAPFFEKLPEQIKWIIDLHNNLFSGLAEFLKKMGIKVIEKGKETYENIKTNPNKTIKTESPLFPSPKKWSDNMMKRQEASLGIGRMSQGITQNNTTSITINGYNQDPHTLAQIIDEKISMSQEKYKDREEKRLLAQVNLTGTLA